jgi:hypothetical protein
MSAPFVLVLLLGSAKSDAITVIDMPDRATAERCLSVARNARSFDDGFILDRTH